jgi:hypothetical protein
MTSRYLIIVFCIFNPFAIDLSKGVSKYFVKNIVFTAVQLGHRLYIICDWAV